MIPCIHIILDSYKITLYALYITTQWRFTVTTKVWVMAATRVAVLHLNPFITTSIYATPRILRHIFCGINSSLLTVTLHSSVRTTLVYYYTKYSVPFITLQPSSTVTGQNFTTGDWVRLLTQFPSDLYKGLHILVLVRIHIQTCSSSTTMGFSVEQ